jgi:hypothetical protein
LVTAHLAGFRETWFPPPAVCFHIEHAIGSGYTAENQAPMFERIGRQGIGWFDFNVIESLFEEMREKGTLELNTDAWGMRDIPLHETVCTREGIKVQKVPEAFLPDRYAPVTAIRPELNADWPFRVALRRLVHAFDDKHAQLERWMAEMKEGRKRLRRGRTQLRRARKERKAGRKQLRRGRKRLKCNLENIGESSGRWKSFTTK